MLALHHVGYLVDNIPLTARSFEARFGYVAESLIITDPVQTAHVQFLRQPEGGNWIELISPTGNESKLSNSLRKGGGLHHLCYEVTDLPNTCEKLRDEQMLMICAPVPAAAFPGRKIAWFMGQDRLLVELLESGPGPLSLSLLNMSKKRN